VEQKTRESELSIEPEALPTSTSTSQRFRIDVSEAVHVRLHDFQMRVKYNARNAGALIEALLIATGDMIDPVQVNAFNEKNCIIFSHILDIIMECPSFTATAAGMANRLGDGRSCRKWCWRRWRVGDGGRMVNVLADDNEMVAGKVNSLGEAVGWRTTATAAVTESGLLWQQGR